METLESLEDKDFIKLSTLIKKHQKKIEKEELVWAENFIEQYKNMVTATYRETAYYYNTALLHFRKKDYLTAIKYINQVEFEDIYYALTARLLMLKIFYEQNDDILFDSNTNSILQYLKRNTSLPSVQKEAWINLVQLTKKAYHIKNSFKTKQEKEDNLKILKKTVESTKNIINSD